MKRRNAATSYQTAVLATVWALALVASLSLRQLEIFLLLAPLSAGIYLLFPARA